MHNNINNDKFFFERQKNVIIIIIINANSSLYKEYKQANNNKLAQEQNSLRLNIRGSSVLTKDI